MRKLFLVGLLASAPVWAAPRTPYGGALVGYVWGRPISTHPRDLATAADATVQRAIFDSLYRVNGEGVLIPQLAAALPVVEGRTVTVALRHGLVAHDGTPVDAEQIVQWLTDLVEPGSRAAFVLLPVTGARTRLRGSDVALAVEASDKTTLTFKLDHPHPEFPRLLASAHAGIGVTSGAGTGPFRIADKTTDGVTLLPFVQHFVGRPFLDRVHVRPLASRFGAGSIIRRERAGLVFGVPDTRRSSGSPRLQWPRFAHSEQIVLSVGDKIPGGLTAELVTALDRALQRKRLARRYLSAGAKPTETFLNIPRKSPTTEQKRPEPIKATMLVAKEARAGQRFAERVQLDLLRAGVTVVIRRIPAARLEARRRSRDYELMLDVVLPDSPSGFVPVDQLHGLLSIASSYGRTGFLSADTIHTFVQADHPAQVEMLTVVDAKLRTEVGLLPIAAREPAVSVQRTLPGLMVDPLGAVDLADVYLPASE